MVVYVVVGTSLVYGCSLKREEAEELVAKKIERACKYTGEAECQKGRYYDVKVTLFVVNKGQEVLTSFDSKELRYALNGVDMVKVETAGLIETYHIQDINLAD